MKLEERVEQYKLQCERMKRNMDNLKSQLIKLKEEQQKLQETTSEDRFRVSTNLQTEILVDNTLPTQSHVGSHGRYHKSMTPKVEVYQTDGS